MTVQILCGDTREVLKTLPAESVQTCVTSPPYFGLRSYLPDGHSDKGKEIGLEQSPQEYVDQIVAVFREVRRVLRKDGTAWLNLGDSYAGHNATGFRPGNEAKNGGASNKSGVGRLDGCKPKDLLLIPARVALALQADGWWLRSDIIWHKLAPMPESVRDRPTSAHEHVFLLTKSERYFYDAEAVAEAVQAVRADASARDVLPAKGRQHGKPVQAVQEAERDGLARYGSGTTEVSGRELFGGWTGQDAPLLREPQGIGGCEAEARQAPRTIESDGCDAHGGGMAGCHGSTPDEVRVLQAAAGRTDTRPCGADQQGRASRQDQRGSSLPAVQQQEEGPAAATRNLRNVWSLAPEPFPGAHFATMPPTLAERCIKAGTSEKGQCPHCGAPWGRVIESESRPNRDNCNTKYGGHRGVSGGVGNDRRQRADLGWAQSCSCPPHEPVPQTVLDPFAGAGTTLLVADRLQRHGIGIELNPAYIAIAQERLRGDAPLFAEVA